jgi:hypothetical protein
VTQLLPITEEREFEIASQEHAIGVFREELTDEHRTYASVFGSYHAADLTAVAIKPSDQSWTQRAARVSAVKAAIDSLERSQRFILNSRGLQDDQLSISAGDMRAALSGVKFIGPDEPVFGKIEQYTNYGAGVLDLPVLTTESGDRFSLEVLREGIAAHDMLGRTALVFPGEPGQLHVFEMSPREYTRSAKVLKQRWESISTDRYLPMTFRDFLGCEYRNDPSLDRLSREVRRETPGLVL